MYSSGARYLCMFCHEGVFRSIWPKRKLQASSIKLQTYSKEPLSVVGSLDVNVEHNDQAAQLTLLVIKGDGPTLLGRALFVLIGPEFIILPPQSCRHYWTSTETYSRKDWEFSKDIRPG